MTRSKLSAEPQWPPRSPREALLGTPGGRERHRRLNEQTSPSPSPLRRRRALNGAIDSLPEDVGKDTGEIDEDDDDEETLQLKLQEIQARLKLKRLQRDKSKARSTTEDNAAPAHSERVPRPSSTQPLQDISEPANELGRAPSSQSIVIPASPVRRVQLDEVRTSPSRILLGIDKGRKASDISLKRAPGSRKRLDNQSVTSGPKGLTFSDSLNGLSQPATDPPRFRSFNERLAAARTEEEEKKERQERIKRMRTNAFGISKDEMERLKTSAVTIPDVELQPTEYSREQVLQGALQLYSHGGLPRSNTPSSIPNEGPAASPKIKSASPWLKRRPVPVPETESSSFETFSSFHLSKRIMPHITLARQLRSKKVYHIKDLLREVKSPDYELPGVEEDVVVFAIVASKSDPRTHRPTTYGADVPEKDKTKYMVITIVDLKWELELFLFNSGFTRFWKLTEGTVIAILNPNIMAPPRANTHSGKFSLVINSDADTIIEVGTSRDLGFCKSMKKDGQLCSSWLNKNRTEFCEYHSNEIVRKSRASRLELNQMGFGNEHRKKSSLVARPNWKSKSSANGTYDRDTQTHWFASKSMSASALIDGVADRKEKADAMKRRLLAREKEQEMMKALSTRGTGTGQEYMRSAGTKPTGSEDPAPTTSSRLFSQANPGASDFGLIGIRGNANVSLGPAKRKRPDSSLSLASADSGRGGGLGWGGGLSKKLSRMKEGEKLAPDRKRSQSPVKKKTRFITAKGIRVAGRESLGGEELGSGKAEADDDEDELIILR